MGSAPGTGAPWTVDMIETTVVRVRAEENFMMDVRILMKWKFDLYEVVLVPCRR